MSAGRGERKNIPFHTSHLLVPRLPTTHVIESVAYCSVENNYIKRQEYLSPKLCFSITYQSKLRYIFQDGDVQGAPLSQLTSELTLALVKRISMQCIRLNYVILKQSWFCCSFPSLNTFSILLFSHLYPSLRQLFTAVPTLVLCFLLPLSPLCGPALLL